MKNMRTKLRNRTRHGEPDTHLIEVLTEERIRHVLAEEIIKDLTISQSLRKT